jgi:hypothetical protein
MTRLDYLFKQHESIIGWYKQSEEKARFIVSLNTLAVGVVNGLVFIGADRIKSARLLYTAPIWLLLALSGMALISSYLLTLRAMWPRHHWRDASLKRSQRMWFFGDVASMSREDFAATMAEWSEQDLEQTLVAQNRILSKSVWTKHESLNWAIAFTIVALMLLFGLGVAYGIAVVNMPL